ncbi:MAG: fluoride efflux transporter CrcB [Gemmatimonadota bacterium]
MGRWLSQALIVGLGGFLGAVLRFGTGTAVTRYLPPISFPVGTLLVNWLGCLVIGMALGIIDVRGSFTGNVRLFMMVGLLGGFTTFSAFGAETLLLWRDGGTVRAALNILAQVVGGLALAWLGFRLGGGLGRGSWG